MSKHNTAPSTLGQIEEGADPAELGCDPHEVADKIEREASDTGLSPDEVFDRLGGAYEADMENGDLDAAMHVEDVAVAIDEDVYGADDLGD
jgi:hypothetical protein